ncbi:FMN-binding protein [Curtobacterium sp. 20TX0008]|uniref:FMN-binding protein n=1 Tax=Curtobacterium sp. 20TX0008 TaxID=3022018 RepID=UPI00232D9ED5|nr:FMN-binding protein [Curtobacterium sp. 20TX0008]MDB6426795.1 FMN-binding protein [Curtobacterium sp. 20TX0008]
MRARVVVGGVPSSVAVLAIGWQLGGQPAVTTPAQGTTSGSGSSGSAGSGGTSGSSASPGPSGTGSSASGSSASGSSGASDSGTFTGAAAQTQYGEVQVQITVADGKITDVTPLHLTDRDGRSVAISQQAAPILRQEALQTQSAQIQAVSGATFTSGGYTTSLQSAIDQAGL